MRYDWLTMSDADVNVYALDAAYEPFPTFERWASETTVDTTRYERYISSLRDHASLPPEVLARAREIVKRAAALDTGAIEGLYEVDRGFTFTVAFETAAWEAALALKGDHVRPLFEAQLHAYDYVLDLATKAEPISEAAIRTLQEQVTRAQSTYLVNTAVGPQEQPLPKGQYKALPNHVRTRKGTNHSYAPVDATPAEMARLVAALRSDAFLAAHPVLQAAYAHYGLVVIHPFADGNGRVARALASTFTYRAISMPIVILSEHKDAYLDALESADGGDYQVFVDFMLARSLDTIKLVDQSVTAALVPQAAQSLVAIDALYFTRGGYTHEEVDKAGYQLTQAFAEELKKARKTYDLPRIQGNPTVTVTSYGVSDPAYRLPPAGGRQVTITLGTKAPADASVSRNFQLFVPKAAAGEDDLLLQNAPGSQKFGARVEEIAPVLSGSLQMRLSIFADQVIREMLLELAPLAEKALRQKGY